MDYFPYELLAAGGRGLPHLSHGMERTRPDSWAPIINCHSPCFVRTRKPFLL